MAFIGNTNTTQAFTPAIDYFSGNGSTTAFTLSRPVASVAQIQVVVNNVAQNPSSAYTVSGNTITFTSAPSSGTNNIYVYYTSPITQDNPLTQSPSLVGDVNVSGGFYAKGTFNSGYVDGTVVDNTTGTGRITVGPADGFKIRNGGPSSPTDLVTVDSSGNAVFISTGALTIPSGTTAQRPGTPTTGMIRQNSTTGTPEWYDSVSGQWVQFNNAAPYAIQYIIVAGGGGGGGVNNIGSGGGGAGGYLTGTYYATTGASLGVTVGGGGSAGLGTGNGNLGGPGGSGSNSVFGALTAIGGGGGGVRSGYPNATDGPLAGGSGGGTNSTPGAPGTSGQGNTGGTGTNNGGSPSAGGGGGGASAVGSNNASSSVGGAGGAGTTDTWTGSSRTLAGGGGGGGSGGGGAGGSGGGGSANGGSGSANTGGGGAGTWAFQALANGGSGGSGIVVLRYLGSQRGSGGAVTSSGGYTIHTFITSGTYTA